MSDAYLDNGYGEQIIRAFAEKRELEFLEQTYQKLDLTDKRNIQSLQPEWYRKTTHSNKGDIFFRICLCSSKREIACVSLWKIAFFV